MVAQVHCPQADAAVSAVVAQVEQAQQLAMVLAAVVTQQVEQVQQRSMTTSEVQQALLMPLQMHLPTSIGAAATWCASSVVRSDLHCQCIICIMSMGDACCGSGSG